MTTRTVYRRIPRTLIAMIAVIVVVGWFTGCAREPAWQHGTLLGVAADVQRDSDQAWCKEQMPHELPVAVYVNPEVGMVYESQDGRGLGHNMSSLARTGSLDVIRSGGDYISPRKLDDAHRRRVYRQCMVERGWTAKQRRDPRGWPIGWEEQLRRLGALNAR